ncbi:acyl-CoA dehydrogenase [Streptomyces sp. MS2A]|nr:acyl-CoA dehydrogenase [Streptomyces sp. MS2A]
MRLLTTEEQDAVAAAIDDVVEAAGGADVAQSWAAGDLSAGLALWAQFAELGLTGLRVPETEGGFGGGLDDLVVVFERLGFHGVPGPYVETVALLPRLISEADRAALVGGAVATAAVSGLSPFAPDPDAATLRYVVDSDRIAPATLERTGQSLAPTRRLGVLAADGEGRAIAPDARASAEREAVLAASAVLLGAGERLLREAVQYAGVREQFGRPIGEFQALKHQLADVRVALSFARPLLWNAALTADTGTGDRDSSAAKIAASEAATRAARVALQVHGAIGYTAEHPLRIWLGLVPALSRVWGTPAQHRARVAGAILSDGSSARERA